MADVRVSCWQQFNEQNYLEPALIHAPLFNPFLGGDFIASVLFKLGGAALPVGPTEYHLFGLDVNPGFGWSMTLQTFPFAINGEWGVVARNNAPAAVALASFELSRNLGAPDSPRTGLVERLILATMYWDAAAQTVALFINGDRVFTAATAAAYVDGVISPRIGMSPGAPQPAPGLGIVGAAFTRFEQGAGPVSTIDALMGTHYNACRAANNMAMLAIERESALVDFTHRWNARDSVVTPGGPTARAPNTAREVFTYTQPLVSLAPSGSTVPDIGNRGWTSNSSEGPAPLVVTTDGPAPLALTVLAVENPNWHVGGNFQAGVA
jgi:hypothetical protein